MTYNLEVSARAEQAQLQGYVNILTKLRREYATGTETYNALTHALNRVYDDLIDAANSVTFTSSKATCDICLQDYPLPELMFKRHRCRLCNTAYLVSHLSLSVVRRRVKQLVEAGRLAELHERSEAYASDLGENSLERYKADLAVLFADPPVPAV